MFAEKKISANINKRASATAGVVKLADTIDLGSIAYGVQVQVLSPAFIKVKNSLINRRHSSLFFKINIVAL